MLDGWTIDGARFETAVPRDLRSRLDFALMPASGSLDSVDNTLQDLETQGGARVLPPVPGTLRVRSTDAGDNPAGAGAGFVLINALDPELGNTGGTLPADVYTPWANLFLALNGTNWVTAPNTWLRALVALTALAGAAAPAVPSNLGRIIVEIDMVEQIEIPIGKGISASSHATVPKGWSAIFDRIFISTNVTANMTTRGLGSGFAAITAFDTEVASGVFTEFRFDPVPAASGTDTWIQVIRPGGAAAGKFSAFSNQLLIRNET